MRLYHLAILGLLVFASIEALLVPVPVYSETVPVSGDSWSSLEAALSLSQGRSELNNFYFSIHVPEGNYTWTISCDYLFAEGKLSPDRSDSVFDYSLVCRGLKVEASGQRGESLSLGFDDYSLSSTVRLRYDSGNLTVSTYAPRISVFLSSLR